MHYINGFCIANGLLQKFLKDSSSNSPWILTAPPQLHILSLMQGLLYTRTGNQKYESNVIQLFAKVYTQLVHTLL